MLLFFKRKSIVHYFFHLFVYIIIDISIRPLSKQFPEISESLLKIEILHRKSFSAHLWYYAYLHTFFVNLHIYQYHWINVAENFRTHRTVNQCIMLFTQFLMRRDQLLWCDVSSTWFVYANFIIIHFVSQQEDISYIWKLYTCS